jgi:Coenzyme PQQ synthesis protein D (PqqD)
LAVQAGLFLKTGLASAETAGARPPAAGILHTMPDQPADMAFIGRALRPELGPSDKNPQPLSPDAPKDALQMQASALLGEDMSARLGIGDPGGVPLRADQSWTRKADVVWSTVDGEAVLLDLSSGYYFSLNKVGAVIWEMLDGEHSLQAIHDAICGRFRVDASTAWEDIAALVRRLAGEKLAALGQAG